MNATDVDILGMAVRRVGMLGVSVRKVRTLKMETVTLLGKGRENMTCCVY